MKQILLGFLIILGVGSLLLTSCITPKEKIINKVKPVIVIAAFGSSYESGQRDLENFDKAVRLAFPQNEVTWGFTASFIVKKLQKSGINTLFESQVPVRTIDETIATLAKEGKTNVVVVNFLLMVGEEYREVMNVPTPGLNVKYVHPILYYDDNIKNVVTALEGEFGNKDTATVVCAHGNEAHPQYNAELIEISEILKTDYNNVYLALMEGEPSFGPVKESILASDSKRVKFITFMLTFGDHMSNDVMGDEENSFKEQLGLDAEVSGGLASIPTFQQLFLDRISLSLKQF